MQPENSLQPENVSHVVVTDIKMPFGSMVSFMVKWAIASIPAFIILAILIATVGSFLAGLFVGIFGIML